MKIHSRRLPLYIFESHIRRLVYSAQLLRCGSVWGESPSRRKDKTQSISTHEIREREIEYSTQFFHFFFSSFMSIRVETFFWKGNCVLLLLLTYGMSGIGGRYITHPHASRASFVSRVHLHKTPRESIDSWCVSITLDTKAPKSSAVAPFAPTADILLCSIWCRFIYFFQDQIKRGSCRT